MYIHAYTHTHIHIAARIHAYTYANIHIAARIHAYTYTHMHIAARIHAYTYTHMHIAARIQTHFHTPTQFILSLNRRKRKLLRTFSLPHSRNPALSQSRTYCRSPATMGAGREQHMDECDIYTAPQVRCNIRIHITFVPGHLFNINKLYC